MLCLRKKNKKKVTCQEHDEAVNANPEPSRRGHAALQSIKEIVVNIASFLVSRSLFDRGRTCLMISHS